MNNFLGQLNLTTQERRVVVVIFLVCIVVLNMLFVWPHFGEWGRLNKQLADMRQKIVEDNHFIAQDIDPTNGWRKQVAKLSKEGGSVSENKVDPQVQFQRTIQEQERKTGVLVDTISPGSVKTNAFFEEHSTTISAQSMEPQLISFLFNMGNDPAMIRVAKLDLQPMDANRYRLKASITLTANYTKKEASAVTAPAATKPAFAKKPATPAPKPGAPPGQGQSVRRQPVGPHGPGPNKQLPGGKKNNPPNKAFPGKRPPGQQL